MAGTMYDALERLYHSGLQFLLPLTPDETYATLVAEAKELIHAEHGTILIAQNGVMKRVYSTITTPLPITPRKKGFTSSVFASGEPLVIQAEEVLPIHPELSQLGFRQSVMVPLTYYNQALGVMILSLTSRRRITKKELQLLKIFGAIATLSIRKTQLYQEEKKALATRDAFLNMISHELKSPVTAMNVYLHLLQKNADKIQQPLSQWVFELSKELAEFTRTLNELLHVEKLTNDVSLSDMQVLDLKDIVRSILEELRVLYPEYTIHFVTKKGKRAYFVEGSKKRLTQAVRHIIHNAIKFSSPKHAITVDLTFDSPSYVLSIEDRGRGIAKRHIHMIPSKFYKPKSNYKDGLGLGLFLSKTIINQHNGTMQILSSRNKGTKVTVSLPALHIS